MCLRRKKKTLALTQRNSDYKKTYSISTEEKTMSVMGNKFYRIKSRSNTAEKISEFEM